MTYYIGIDASTSSTGYAVLNKELELIDKGTYTAKADDPGAFASLYSNLYGLFEYYQPEYIVCEQQFVGRNMNTTIKLARPTGVVLAAAGTLSPETQFDFLVPSSWRKLYHKDTAYEKKYSKKDSFKVTQFRFPGVVSNFNKENDISDAIGIAYAAAKLAKKNET